MDNTCVLKSTVATFEGVKDVFQDLHGRTNDGYTNLAYLNSECLASGERY
jgi:hypothetical protein